VSRERFARLRGRTPSFSLGEAQRTSVEAKKRRARMSGQERREQLIDVGRSMFAQKGFQATSIEEIAQRAKITKPLVYEHFGGKQGLYAVVVDRARSRPSSIGTDGLDAEHPRLMLEQAALAFPGYIQDNPEGFRVLVRDFSCDRNGRDAGERHRRCRITSGVHPGRGVLEEGVRRQACAVVFPCAGGHDGSGRRMMDGCRQTSDRGCGRASGERRVERAQQAGRGARSGHDVGKEGDHRTLTGQKSNTGKVPCDYLGGSPLDTSSF
jgi:AcrR family transcriptional regulator